MPTANVDGIETYYETHGSGTPILMCAPGGFDATIEKWRVASAWTGIDAIQALAAEHTVILYDRRECGRSGGRVERLSWATFTAHGKALLDHLHVDPHLALIASNDARAELDHDEAWLARLVIRAREHEIGPATAQALEPLQIAAEHISNGFQDRPSKMGAGVAQGEAEEHRSHLGVKFGEESPFQVR